jgi:Protein of unknown function (DUF2948)
VTDSGTGRLHLRAESAEDLPALSALVQDMTVIADDIAYDVRRRQLSLIGNRFRHEADGQTRIRSALRCDFVDALQHRAMPADPRTVLALLALTLEGDQLTLAFANGTTLRATIETLDITLDDVSGPWGAQAVPHHE